MQGERGWNQGLWQRVAGEMGWTAVALPEQYGGYGLGAVELSVLMEEMGAGLLCAPFFSTVCLAANALLLAGSEEQKQQWLPRIAAGEISAALAFAENDGSREAGGIQATATADGDGWRLDGVKSFVVDGATADLLVVAACEAGGSSPDDLALFLVEAGADGLACVETPGMDHTRRLARVGLKGVQLDADARMVGGWAELEGTLDLAAVALAAEQLGGASRVLDSTVAYAKERSQFGRPIGGFQAIKHKLADVMVKVESARSAAYYAAWAASVGDSTLPRLSSLALSYCSESFFTAAAESIQVHGGVGFSWEYDCHLYFKRARAGATLLGDPDWHRERIARLLGIGCPDRAGLEA